MGLRQLLANTLIGLILAASLAGCGFQLRGQEQLPFTAAYVEAEDSSYLAPALRKSLGSEGKLATSKEAAPVRIVLTAESRAKNILSLSGGGKVKEYRLIYKVLISVVDTAGKDLIAPSEIQLSREFSYSDAEILSKEAEEARLNRAMNQEALHQALRRLSYIKR